MLLLGSFVIREKALRLAKKIASKGRNIRWAVA